MKQITDYLAKQPIAALAVAGSIVLVVIYFLARKTISDVASAGAGVLSGDNAATQNQTNLAGDKTTAYEGKGITGTVGAVVNSATGGLAASAGESIGGWLFDKFGPKIDLSNNTAPAARNGSTINTTDH